MKESARDREALLLPSGKLDSAFPDDGIVALRQLLDELVRIGLLRSPPNIAQPRIRTGVADVLPYLSR